MRVNPTTTKPKPLADDAALRKALASTARPPGRAPCPAA